MRIETDRGHVHPVVVGAGNVGEPDWYWFTAFVGANLLQSDFTNWCPMMTFLRKFGVGAQKQST